RPRLSFCLDARATPAQECGPLEAAMRHIFVSLSLTSLLFLVACADDAGSDSVEICTNNVDDDGDGIIDCNDNYCATHPACVESEEDCQNGQDDDGDGMVDCMDPTCAASQECTGDEICNNGTDDDGDGAADCDDTGSCAAHPACGGG